MRKISLKITKEDSGEVKVKPGGTNELTSEEHTRLENALSELTFLRTYSSRLTIRLASWDAVEAAFEDYRVRVVPDEKQPAEKYADIHFLIEAKNEQ